MSLQHPEFERFKQAYAQTRYQDALHSLMALLDQHPDSLALRWHRANVLEKLERYAEARVAVEEVLQLKSDFVPALIRRVVLDFDEHAADDDAEISDKERLRREQIAAAQNAQRAERSEQRLRAVLAIDPDAVDALRLLSQLLRDQRHPDAQIESNRLLDYAISLAPQRADLFEARASVLRARALLPFADEVSLDAADGADPADVVTTFSGMRYSRSLLERALADFQTCYRLSGEARYALRVGSLLHDLGRFDEALLAYDAALAVMPSEDPRRAFIVEPRARSENNGAGEREQMARLLEAAVAGEGGDRAQGEDVVAQAVLSAANAVRAGKSVSAAMDARISDDPDQMLATSIAAQILNLANEPAPGLAMVDAKTFPAYQRKFVDKRKRELTLLGLRHIADAEAQGMKLMLGKRILLSFFADENGESGVACFAMKPKWPGWLGFLILFCTGKWKVTDMTECVSQFDDGALISTQYVSPSPFEFGPPVYIEKLPRSASVTELVTRHSGRIAEYRRAHPDAEPMRVSDLAGIEQRWIDGQQIKRAYRQSIGYITDNELKGLLGAHYGRFAVKVRERLQVLAQDL